jgi:predicted transcriptional regulator
MWSYRRPASVRDVLQDLRRGRQIAYTTVMTVMDNLHRKGLLRRQMLGRAYVYEVVGSKEAYAAELMRGSLAVSGNQAATLVHFLEGLTAQETAALEAALRVYPLAGRRP